MTQIGMIIEAVLEKHESKCLDNDEERNFVAEQCERALLLAVGEQYLALTEQAGLSLEDEEYGLD